jgi:6-phosphogluconolactonase (cycloisomerase 2 family)
MILATICCAQSVKYTAVVKNGIDGVDGLLSPTSIAVSPDNKNVYAGCTMESALLVFDRDSSTGILAFKNCIKYCVNGVSALSRMIFVTVSPDNKNIYVAGDNDNTVAVYDRNSLTGALTYKTCVTNGTAGVNGLAGANAVIVSPDNKNVYVTGGKDNSLAVFTRNTANGELTYSTCFKNGTGGVNGLYGVMSVALCANGQSVYCSGSNGISVFKRDSATGSLSWVSDYLLSMREGPMSTILASSDNKNVYALDGINHTLSEFRRDTVTGAITYTGGITGITFGGKNILWGANSMCLGSDGRSVYATAGSDSAIILFKRITSTGSLTYDTCMQSGHNGISGLRWASALTVSPDNKNLYVLGPGDSSIAIFTLTDSNSSAVINAKFLHSGKSPSIRLLNNNRAIVISTPLKAKWTLCTIDGRVVRTGIFQHSGQFTITGIQSGAGLFTIETAGGQRYAVRFMVH